MRERVTHSAGSTSDKTRFLLQPAAALLLKLLCQQTQKCCDTAQENVLWQNHNAD